MGHTAPTDATISVQHGVLFEVDFQTMQLSRLKHLHSIEHGMNTNEPATWDEVAEGLMKSLERFISKDLMPTTNPCLHHPYAIGVGVGNLDPQQGNQRNAQQERLLNEIKLFLDRNKISYRDLTQPTARLRGNLSSIS